MICNTEIYLNVSHAPEVIDGDKPDREGRKPSVSPFVAEPIGTVVHITVSNRTVSTLGSEGLFGSATVS
jgi:hypothetical protein